MPRKDNITGCMVMTLPEFLNEEAERENKEKGTNKTGGDILADIYSELNADNARMEEEYRNPKTALSTLQNIASQEIQVWSHGRNYGKPRHHKYPIIKWVERTGKPARRVITGYYEDPVLTRPHYPVEVLEVLDTKYHQSFRSSGGEIKARVRCDDGFVRTVTYSHSSWDGTRIDPPDHDESLNWEN